MHIVADIRKFRDHCGNDLWGIIKGTRVAPVPFTAAEEAAMRVGERTARVLDCEVQIRKYEEKRDSAFALILKFVSNETTLYTCAEMDVFRDRVPLDPVATWTFVMGKLTPQSMDAQLLIEAQIGALAFMANEKLSMLIGRLDELVARLPAATRPTDDAKIKHVTRAIKAKETCYRRHQYVMDVLKIAVPATTYSDFCSKLIKIEEEDALEQETHVVLVNDANAANHHVANESVNAVEAGRGRGRGARGRGRGDNRKRRHFNSGQDFARGHAQQPEQDYYGRVNGGPHMRGDQRQNGGRAGRGPFGHCDRGRGVGRGANKRVRFDSPGANTRQGHEIAGCHASSHGVTGAPLRR
jgi:hypothetical protein